jgi:uracil-DNA glycosylase family 4
LTQAIQSCTACELCHGRKQAVPGMILALGRLAAQTVLAGTAPGSDTLPLGKLRGHVHTAAGHPMVVTYHPTYLRGNPAEKGKVWSDLCLAMAHVGHNPMSQPGT